MYIHIIEASATGTLSMAALLANSQSSDGHEVTVVYSKRQETPENIKSLFNVSVRLICLDMTSFLGRLLGPLRLSKIINNSGHTTVILHSSFAGFIGRIAGLLCAKSINFFYIPHCISFMRKDIGSFKLKLFVILEKVANIKKSTYIACSESERSLIKKKLPKVDCSLVENAVSNNFSGVINIDSFGDTSLEVITVGQIRVQKNPLLFAEIYKAVISVNEKIKFKWVGDGDQELKKILVDHGVEVTGWLTRDKVINNLKGANLYLSTSDWEGLPVSVIEANYAGIPVIVSNCPGNNDVVRDGVTGWLFNTSHEAVEYLLTIPMLTEDRIMIAKAAQNEALERFSKSRYISSMKSIMTNANR